MSYELAKKLKDAGFPFTTSGYFIEPSGMNVLGAQTADRLDLGYAPTLSELIEACGERFYALWRSKNEWRAAERIGVLGDQDHESGSTPEEAVARLWLSL